MRWIQLLNGSLVKPELQEALCNYQRYIFDYLYGDIKANDAAMKDYLKLKTLKHEYGRIGREIQTVQSSLYNYLDNAFVPQETLAEAN